MTRKYTRPGEKTPSRPPYPSNTSYSPYSSGTSRYQSSYTLPTTSKKRSNWLMLGGGGIIFVVLAAVLALVFINPDEEAERTETSSAVPSAMPAETINPAITQVELIQSSQEAVVLIKASLSSDGLTAQGTGFFIDRHHIVTNQHVVERARDVSIRYKGREYDVTIVGESPCDDIAVLYFERDASSWLNISDVEPIVGEEVFAIGFPLYGATRAEDASVHRGYITRINGSLDHLVQVIEHQAPLNPGNSGGPLISFSSGKLVGINTMVVVGTSGLQFAIDVRHARQVWERLINKEPYNATVTLRLGREFSGELESNTSVDCYGFSGRQGDNLRFKVTATDPLLDTELYLYGSDNTLLSYNDDGGGSRSSQIDIQMPATGSYMVVVKSFEGESEGKYKLVVERR